MKKFFFYLAFVLFLQSVNNLDGMHHLRVGYGSCQPTDEYAQLRIDIKQEAEQAIVTINEWLNKDVAEKLVCPDGTINCEELDKLSCGQRIVLGGWNMFPQYIPVIYAASGKISGGNAHFECYSGISYKRNNKKFTDALIKHNFGNDFFEIIKIFSIEERLCVWKLYAVLLKIAPYLKHLKQKMNYLSVDDFKAEIIKCNDDAHRMYPDIGLIDWRNILFLLQNPYFFMTHILTWSGQNHQVKDWQDIYTHDGNCVIELLLEFGFDVNCMLGTGCDLRDTLLHRAIRYDDVSMVELLLKWDADPLICYEREPDPAKRYNGSGQSSWELSCHKMKGDTWINPPRPPNKRTKKIHKLLVAHISKNIPDNVNDV